MVCRWSCSGASVFIIGMIYMINRSEKSKLVKEYEESLSKELKEKYEEIVNERKKIYYTGYLLGFIIALMVIMLNIFMLKTKVSGISMVCQTILISFVINYFYYILSPKKKMMLEYIKTEEETKAWLKMYKGMQYNYHMGMLLGLIAVGLMGYAFRCV